MRKIAALVVLLIAIPATAYGGGGGGDISQCSGFGSGRTVSMLDSCFEAIAHTAPADTSLTISNDGQLPHTLTAVDGSFDTGMLQAGQTAELTIDEPGIYQVFCTLHGTAEGTGMAGVLIVGEPEPGTVNASLDSGAIKAAIAEENRFIAEALDRQSRSLGDLRASQAEMKVRFEQSERNAPEAAEPVVVTVPGAPIETTNPWMLMGVGLAGAMSLAALVMAPRRPRQEFEGAPNNSASD